MAGQSANSGDERESLLAWIVSYDQLSGWPGHTDIPAGCVGLVIRDGQVVDTLAPGRHTVIRWGDIFRGSAATTEVAVINTQPVFATLTLRALLTVEADLADLWAQFVFEVGDPLAFYSSFARKSWPVSRNQAVDTVVGVASRNIESKVRIYSVAVAASPQVTAALALALLEVLLPPAAALGLRLQRLCHVTLCPAEDEVIRAEKLRELAHRLRQVKIDADVDAATQGAEMLELARQMEKDYDLPSGWLTVTHEPGTDPGGQDLTALDLVARVEDLQPGAEEELDRSLERISTRVDVAKDCEAPGMQEPWWVSYIKALRWGSYLVYLSFVLLAVVRPDVPYLDAWPRLVYLLGGLPFALVMFLSALHLDRKAARIRAASRQHPLVTLGGGNVRKADELVRQQLATELDEAINALQETRKRLFRTGHPDLALCLKVVVDYADRVRQTVIQQADALPAYLTSSDASPVQLAAWLKQEEKLLRQVGAMADSASSLRRSVLENTDAVNSVAAELHARLDNIAATFGARSRLAQVSMASSEPAMD